MGKFSSLETNVSEIGQMAVQTGDELETYDKQRRQIKEAKDLVNVYLKAREGKFSSIKDFDPQKVHLSI